MCGAGKVLCLDQKLLDVDHPLTLSEQIEVHALIYLRISLPISMAHDYHEMSTLRPIWFFTNDIEQKAQIVKNGRILTGFVLEGVNRDVA